jgi:hypothetical protein
MALGGRTVGIKPSARNSKSTMMPALTMEMNKTAVM